MNVYGGVIVFTITVFPLRTPSLIRVSKGVTFSDAFPDRSATLQMWWFQDQMASAGSFNTIASRLEKSGTPLVGKMNVQRKPM
jgi:hypothetical protein